MGATREPGRNLVFPPDSRAFQSNLWQTGAVTSEQQTGLIGVGPIFAARSTSSLLVANIAIT